MRKVLGGGLRNGARTTTAGVPVTATASRARARTFLFSIFAALVAAFALSGPALAAADEGAQPASISSDKIDYAPGELVTLRGSNWLPGETVNIDVNDDQTSTWRRNVDVVADAEGKIVDSFNLPNWFVATYQVVATGETSGTATTSFTDGTVRIRAIGTGGASAPISWERYSNTTCTGMPIDFGSLNAGTSGNGTPLPVDVAAAQSLKVTAGTVANSSFSNWDSGDFTTGTFTSTSNPGCLQGAGNTQNTHVIYTTASANTPPVAAEDAYSVNEDAVLDVAAPAGVLTNDTDADGNSLTAVLVTAPGNGTLTLNANGSFTYTPNANFFGTDSFTYRANDGSADSSTATVSLTVTAVNDAPSFTKGADQTVDEDAAAQSVSGWATAISAGAANESGQALTFSASNDNSGLFLSQPAVSANGTLTFTPAANAHGSATVTVSLSDDGGSGNGGVDTSAAKTFTITVTDVNDDPVANDDAAELAEDSGANAIDVLANDNDGPDEGETLSVTAVTQGTHGSVTFTAAGVSYTPNANFFGSDSFTYTIGDGNGGTDTATVSVTVTNVNDTPAVAADEPSVTVDEGQTASNTGTWSDIDAGDTVTLSASTGTVLKNVDGTWSWSFSTSDGPEDGQAITITAEDSAGAEATATFELTVANVAPTVTLSGADEVDEGDTETYTYTVTDPGADTWTVDDDYPTCGLNGDLVEDSHTATASGGSFACSFPDGDAQTSVAIKVTDSDGTSDTDSQQVIVVEIANLAPVVVAADAQSADEGASKAFDLGSFTDAGAVDGDWSISVDWGDGSLATAFDRATQGSIGSQSHTYADGPATHTVRVTVTDKEGASRWAEFEVSVANMAPTVTFDADLADEVNEGSTHTYSYAISDPGQDTVDSVDVSCGENGDLSNPTNDDEGGSFDCTFPDGDAVSTVSAQATDDDGDAGPTATLDVAVDNVAPVVSAGADQAADEGTLTQFELGSFVDPGADSPWSVVVDWGDGGPDTTLDDHVAAGSLGLSSHAYDDNGTYTVTVTVTDKDGGSGSASFEVTVANVAPSAVLGNDGPVAEGSPATVSFSGQADVSSADTAAGFRYAYDCLGGAFETAPTYAGSSADASHECTFADNGTFTVSAAIVDKDGGYSVYETDVVVENVNPSVTAAAGQSADEGESKAFELGSFGDPGADSPWDVVVDWGDGSTDSSFEATSTGSLASASHSFDDDGTYTVTVTVTDKDGGSGSASFEVEVANVAPEADLEHNGPVAEGSGIELELTNPSDPSQADTTAGFEYRFDCGSGYGDWGSSNTASCPTDDNGSRNVKGEIRDKDGGATEYTATVTIQNVAPTATLNAPASVDEGSAIALSLTAASDPSSVDTTAGFTYAFDCGDGSGYGAFGQSNTASCPTTDNGSRDVQAQIRDKDGGVTEYDDTVTVANVAPTATFSNDGPVDEGSSFSLSLTDAQDVSSVDTAAGFTYAFDCGAGGGYGAYGSSNTASCPTTDNGNRNVKGKIRDKDGGESKYTATVVVNNLDPSVMITSPAVGTLYTMSSTVTVAADFSDLGTGDTHTCVISWDNGLGTTTGTVNEANGSGTCTGSKQLTQSGVYTIRVTVTDDDGGSGFDETLVVVYDPNVGHVTGGGWINSPAGAYRADLTLEGRANFGFNAKYQKGAKTPTGSTEFQFKAGSLNFHSTIYEWLVVAGAKGQFKGTGTINGAGSYGFLLTVTDGQLSGGGGTDKFRIKIWDKNAADAIVYDNASAGGDDIDTASTQEIAGGSIVIHKGK